MKNDIDQQNSTMETSSLWERVERECLQRGWSISRLAEESGVSRATFHQWQQSPSQKPRRQTLHKLAGALNMDPAVLWQQISDPCPESSPFQSSFFPDQQIADGISAVEWNLASEFNRVTNDSVQDVCRDHPSLFEGWTDEEWDELYSTFGVGGALNEQGILQQAEAINRKRETLYQVHVLLETHLAEAARGVIESLYRAVECEQLQDQSSVSDLSRRKAGKSL